MVEPLTSLLPWPALGECVWPNRTSDFSKDLPGIRENDLQASPAIKTRSLAENCEATRWPTGFFLLAASCKHRENHPLMYIVHHSISFGKVSVYGANDLRATYASSSEQAFRCQCRKDAHLHDFLGSGFLFIESTGFAAWNLAHLNVETNLKYISLGEPVLIG